MSVSVVYRGSFLIRNINPGKAWIDKEYRQPPQVQELKRDIPKSPPDTGHNCLFAVGGTVRIRRRNRR